MKFFRKNKAAVSLVETMITVAIISLAGAGIFEILRTGNILFSKNTSLNLSHAESRYGLLELQQDLQGAASTPELTNSAGVVLSSTAVGPAAGVSFQAYAAGPFSIYVPAGSGSNTTISSTASSIQVVTGTQGTSTDYKPLPGQTIHIQVLPTALVEESVSSVSSAASYSGSTVYTLSLSGSLGTGVVLVDPNNNVLSVSCFLTTPVVYVVQGTQLVRQTLNSTGATVSAVLANCLSTSSSTPFTIPTVDGASNSTFVSVSNLTAIDPSDSNRGYHSITTPFTVTIPHFAQLTSKY